MLRLTYGLLILFGVGRGDTYMQTPKGSNNRLNEKSANRQNGNRLFDSQNNNRGGYNVAETGTAGNAFNGGNNFGEGSAQEMWDTNQNQGDSKQYNMVFQEGSLMRWEWTSQHGCGNAMNNCHMVLQFGCDTHDKDDTWAEIESDSPAGRGLGLGNRMMLHDGGNTNTPDAETNFDDENAMENQFDDNNTANRGRHEAEEFYGLCAQRTRQKGFFTADQKLKGHTQKYTRQNPNGQRRGLECPEERDYFPWDFPSPWIDVALLSNDVEYCKTNIAPFSQNVSPKGTCTGGGDNVLPQNNDQAAARTPEECAAAEDNGGNAEPGTWREVSWGVEDNEEWRNKFCQPAAWSQVNHLGNVEGTGLGGQMDSYMWTLPTAAELKSYGCHEYTTGGVNYYRIVTRQRYNISTMDYDPYQTFADQNNDPKNGVISPVTQNPTIDVGAYMQGLRLALNTAQTGRTFQDRSSVLTIVETPVAANSVQAQKQMLNVNVRGKRGNIVQTFPAVEYDFVPNDITIGREQCMHFQWAGSNTHNNGNPAGDGQAGDAGEGAGGTDRSNIMEMKSLRNSYPIPYDKAAEDGTPVEEQSFFDHVDCKYLMQEEMFGNEGETDTWIPADAVKAIFASGGYYYWNAGTNTLGSINNNQAVNPLLNNVSAAFKQGIVCCTRANTPEGDYYFLSTRNNNFTNRAQKLKIKVDAGIAAETFEFYKAS